MNDIQKTIHNNKKEKYIYDSLVKILANTLNISKKMVREMNPPLIEKRNEYGQKYFIITTTRNHKQELIMKPIVISYDTEQIYNSTKDLTWKECLNKVGVSVFIMDKHPIGIQLLKQTPNYDYDTVRMPLDMDFSLKLIKCYLQDYIKNLEDDSFEFLIFGEKVDHINTKGYIVNKEDLKNISNMFKKTDLGITVEDYINFANNIIRFRQYEKFKETINKKENFVEKFISKRKRRTVDLARLATGIAGDIRCKLCGEHHDLINENGDVYVEYHHIIPLKDGGKDEYENLIALCPICHKKAHFGSKEQQIKIQEELLKIKQKEVNTFEINSMFLELANN